MKEEDMPTTINEPSQESENVATLQLPKPKRGFIKKPCRYCGKKCDPRGLPQHERTHARTRLNKKRAPVERARARVNAKARRAYHIKQRAKAFLVNASTNRTNNKVATLQLTDNARAIRLAMLYLIKQDTNHATD